MQRRPLEVRRFWRVAQERYDDAEFLIGEERARAAVYIGGYCVECSLKALIVAATPEARIADAVEGWKRGGGHDLEGLMRQYVRASGLSIPRDVQRHLMRVNGWRVEMRYDSGGTQPAHATDFLQSTRAIMDWARGRLSP